MGADLAAEEQFGPYLVYERLGVGGMATVHRALERGIEGFERVVALKRLLPHLAEDASFIKAFVREAKLASLLNHNNIVQIFELGRVGTEYFISMEYIDGRDIRRILRHARKVTGPPPLHVTVGLLLQLCDALEYAHGRVDDDGHPLGLVHRDVSPSNLLVTSAGHLKVIDFGIAKAQSSQLRTQTGRVKGKLAYMAPEAITGKELDARSDLFAAGVIAHELLTARPLFASKNEYQTLLKVQRGDIIPPSTYNQGVPPELDAIVLEALAREPDQRTRDAATMRDRLLDLRKRYALQTSYRDIAQWLEWAFSIEPPSGGFASQNTFDHSGSGSSSAFDLAAAARSLRGDRALASSRQNTPLPRREEEEAVEIAWGGGDGEVASQPVVLDDVPDVSDKHLGAAPRFDLDDLADHPDDIPASQPTHGAALHVRDTAPQQVVAPPVDEPPPARPITRTPRPFPAAARSSQSRATPDPEAPARRSSQVPATPDPEAPARAARAPSEIALAHEQSHDTERAIPAVSGLAAARPVATRQGIAPASARIATPVPDDAEHLPRKKRPSNVTIGSAIVARESVRSRAWVVVVAIVALGAAATAVTLYLTRGQDRIVINDPVTLRPVPPVETGTVKFMVEPADVEITIEGKTHVGSPWSTQLRPGVHSIQIQRDGYKARLASIELSANETITMMVSLEKLGSQAVADSTLILDSSPSGLEVVVDGKVQSERTPMRMPIAVGPHTIALRQNGSEVWRHQFVAQANVDHDFSPSMTEAKQRERRQRAAAADEAPRRPRTVVDRPKRTEERPSKPTTPADTAPRPPVKLAPATTTSATPPVPVPPPTAIPLPTPPPPKPVVITRTGPITVAPNAVTRVAGETPTLSKSKRAEVPPVVTAKLCIDAGGAVTSVSILSKLERHTSTDLAAALRGWRYAPYKHRGVPHPACFAVSFRVK